MPGLPELLIILTIVILIFGAKKLPDLGKGIGSAIKNFKEGIKSDEEKVAEADTKKVEEKKEESKTSTVKTSETTKV